MTGVSLPGHSERDDETGEGRVPTGIRSLIILEELARTGTPMTATEITAALGLPKPTIHRLCQQLEAEGFLERDLDGRRYLPGRRMREMAAGVTQFSSVFQERHAILERVSTRLGETCNIVSHDKDGMFYLDRVESRWPLKVDLPVSGRVPFHCTASGKLYLSSLRKTQRRTLIHALTLRKYGPNTLTAPEKLMAEVEATAKRRYGIDNEEFIEGMVALAVPVRDAGGRLAAILAVHGPVQRMSLEDVIGHLPVLREGAEQLAAVIDAEAAG
ncbi:ArsR family transcriptional regulator [Rhodobium orientis]|uniref:ArsR family transcriptional regulator n=1 Tax=Rhodobium orientis TaxID=34017 RepID=A0A327JWL9_9HYPH|nr:ArsR family transcriptional regulator [Rhodobium orientis]RAI29976.1 ArsR family transcriptional regulator [Rhodobium orientis]